MSEEKNLNEITPEVSDASESVETVDTAEVNETVVNEAPKSKKDPEKEASRAAGREKAKAKRNARREKLAQKQPKVKEKLHLTAEEKKERREAKAEAAKVQTAKAIAKYIRMSPTKVGIVLDLIRGKDVAEALAILDYTPKDAAYVVAKVIRSAAANAENNFDMDMDKLYVAEAWCGQGSTLKRFQPHAQGRAFQILKRTSNVTVVVAERA